MNPRAGQTKKRTRIQAKNEAKILEAALDIFATFGFRGTTIDQIAQKAEMSKPNLLYYFRRKEDIYISVLERTLDEWLTPLTELNPDGDPIKEIGKYTSLKLQMSQNDPTASRLFANEILHGAPMIEHVLKGSLKDLVDEKAAVIHHWVKSGKLAKVDPYHLIFMIWATTQHYADFKIQMRAILGDEVDQPDYFEKAGNTISTVFFEGIKPR
ncbi:TetR family transcriptional regulator C-terminal domain-containing protein [Kiloniella sp. EL199]|uniref:TetR family transcriptional regulator C-terminal domain-containing protein n=1 Tax=Kiloniella sp. EL199 TaxID=2107581 RepID=UPI000EA2F4A2|nr:TetR family transcriptional regulator C-terminal domain-containing protein [Kiloniella sp. EL199]